MKMKSSLLYVATTAVSILGAQFSNCFAQTTVFTYQGRLTSGSSAYTGVAEIQPTLWDAATGGTQVAANSPSSIVVNVTNGLFVLPLDFGNAPFATGADRWLEIQLRTALGPYTTITPRQRITPTPYALRAGNAATATTAATANSVAAANITGTLGLAQLPGTVLTNNYVGVNLTGAFTGNGAGLSNISVNSLVAESTNVSIVTWGRNDDGERNTPASLANARIVSVSPGALHSLALKSDGTVAAWGAGETNGPPDNGTHYGQSLVPSDLANVRAISAGYVHSLALRSNGTVVAWGWNDFNQTNVPPTANSIVGISAAAYHNLALKADGTVIAWGTNYEAGLLDVPPSLNNVIAVSAGILHNLALKADGTVVVWGGTNQYHQNDIPVGLTGIRAISAGGAHSLVLRSNGTVVAWGAGSVNTPENGVDYGQSIVPAGLSNVVAISAGLYHSLALKSDGTVVGWGFPEYGGEVPTGVNNVVTLGLGSIAAHAMVLRKRFDGPVAMRDSDNTFNGNIQVNGELRSDEIHVSGEASAKSLRLDDGNLFLRGGNDQNNALGWYGAEKPFGLLEPNGPVLFGESGGALGTSGTNGDRVALFWDDSFRVGIGTTTPNARLSLGADPNDSKLLLGDFGSGNGVGLGVIGGNMTLHLANGGRFSFLNQPGGPELLSIWGSGAQGFLGIGTGATFPSAKLDVRGDIRFGTSAQYYPPAAEENLRMIRGVVTAAGTIIVGSGFSVVKGTTGLYSVRFNSAFTAAPAVTATAESQGGLSRSAMTDGVGSTSANIRIVITTTGAVNDAPFHFIAVGPR
ncbi:MAG TPA: hypothetical protein VJ063_07450 [Verrucomicrobiae bacterium]|nr:hypothetical protein [Verrucomicrobiae bacterium]